MSTCDPTWNDCPPPSTTPEPAPSSAPTTDSNGARNSDGTDGASGLTSTWLIYGALNFWMVIDGFLTRSDYNSFVTTLVTGNSGKTLWTENWLKEAEPLSKWYTASTAQMVMHSVILGLWVSEVFVSNLKFVGLLGLFAPILDLFFTY